MSLTLFNEINTTFEVNSNHLRNSVASSELKYYTWGGSDYEYAYDIATDSSNNSYVVGDTSSFGAGERDLCLIKFNSSGVEWNRTFGGTSRDYGRGIALNSEDDIYITGYTESYGAGGFDMWLLKINSTGGVEWNRTFGGTSRDYGMDIELDSEDDIYIAGYTESYGAGDFDMWLLKINSTGSVEWNYTCGGTDTDYGTGVTLDPLGNAYVVGVTKSYGVGEGDVYLAKFNSTGVVWNHTWGCVYDDHGTDVKFSPSGDLYVAGYFELPSDCWTPPGYYIDNDIGLVKFNSEGIYQWNSTWEEGYADYSTGMVLDSSGNAYVSGYTNSDGLSDYDWCLVRFNSSGVADWYCTWGTSESEISGGVVLGSNGTALVTGRTNSTGPSGADICLVEFILGQCPVGIPEDTKDKFVPGYDTIILIGIAFVVSILLIKLIFGESREITSRIKGD